MGVVWRVLGVVVVALLVAPATRGADAVGDGQHGGVRGAHTATLLGDGKVLVAGGEGPSGPLSGAELYDSATGVWSATRSMALARIRAAATCCPAGRCWSSAATGRRAR